MITLMLHEDNVDPERNTVCNVCGFYQKAGSMETGIQYRTKVTVLGDDVAVYEKGPPWFKEYLCNSCHATVLKEIIRNE